MSSFLKYLFSVLFFSLFLLGVDVFAAEIKCGGNFSAGFSYEGIVSSSMGTNITIPVGSEFETELNLISNVFAKGDGNLDLVLVMDRSGSMSGAYKLDKAKNALQDVVDLVERRDNSKIRLALVSYASNATLDVSLTTDYEKIREAINEMDANNNTNIGGALKTAVDCLNLEGGEDSFRYILLASDGMHTDRLMPSVSEGIKLVGNDTTVHTIGIGSDADSYTLKGIAEYSGTKEGNYYEETASELTTAFKDILDEIFFSLEARDVELSFYLENAEMFDFDYSNPSTTFEKENTLSWDNLGLMTDSEMKKFNLFFKQLAGFGTGLSLNSPYVDVSYKLGDLSCMERVSIDRILIDNDPKCIGSAPSYAVMCNNDDENLVVDVYRSLKSSCTDSGKCEYTCRSPFRYDSSLGKCVLDAACGSMSGKTWCLDSEKPSGDWCATGFVASSVYLEGDNWKWKCSGFLGGDNENCSAKRVCIPGWKEVKP